jgi:hypothetical protein
MTDHSELELSTADQRRLARITPLVQGAWRESGNKELIGYLKQNADDPRTCDLALRVAVAGDYAGQLRPILRCKPSQEAVVEALDLYLRDRERKCVPDILEPLLSAVEDPWVQSGKSPIGRFFRRLTLASSDIRRGLRDRNQHYQRNQGDSRCGLLKQGLIGSTVLAIAAAAKGRAESIPLMLGIIGGACAVNHASDTLHNLRIEGAIKRITTRPGGPDAAALRP